MNKKICVIIFSLLWFSYSLKSQDIQEYVDHYFTPIHYQQDSSLRPYQLKTKTYIAEQNGAKKATYIPIFWSSLIKGPRGKYPGGRLTHVFELLSPKDTVRKVIFYGFSEAGEIIEALDESDLQIYNYESTIGIQEPKYTMVKESIVDHIHKIDHPIAYKPKYWKIADWDIPLGITTCKHIYQTDTSGQVKWNAIRFYLDSAYNLIGKIDEIEVAKEVRRDGTELGKLDDVGIDPMIYAEYKALSEIEEIRNHRDRLVISEMYKEIDIKAYIGQTKNEFIIENNLMVRYEWLIWVSHIVFQHTPDRSETQSMEIIFDQENNRIINIINY